ncbi:hypothetical protein [Bacillus sp. 1P06AnD]|uniref:hypothetical protein n=1 Tax=Bacillus sp. 1P06AnD TaxID=3132208 RepID=UPI0039A1BD9A
MEDIRQKLEENNLEKTNWILLKKNKNLEEKVAQLKMELAFQKDEAMLARLATKEYSTALTRLKNQMVELQKRHSGVNLERVGKILRLVKNKG